MNLNEFKYIRMCTILQSTFDIVLGEPTYLIIVFIYLSMFF